MDRRPPKFVFVPLKKLRRSLRRFSRAGGFKTLFSNLVKALKRRDRRALLTVGGAALGLVALIAVLLIVPPRPGARAAYSAGNTEAGKMALTAGEESGALQITPPPTPVPTPTPIPIPRPMLIERGYEGDEVILIQQRLMELSYMDPDEPTHLFGPMTEGAIKVFQRRNGLTEDGVVTQEVYDLLMSDAALTYMVSEGTRGDDVYELQARLRSLGYLDNVSGYFGTETTAAVKKFQQRNHLSADGMIGEETKEMLYSEDVVANAISYGEKSEKVKSYQQRLNKLGYLTTEPDGNFGRDTVAAVKLFQELNGLISDGYVGPETKDLLMSSKAQPNAMTLGMRGTTVERVQNQLKKLGYLSSVTGYYGSDTESAVRTFQKTNKLSNDGRVGKQTMGTLFSDSAKKAPAPPVSGGGDKPKSTPKPGSSTPVYTAADGASVERLIEVAMTRLGYPYRTAGKGPDKFDCSGFVFWSLNNAGVRQSYMTSKAWRSVSKYQNIRSMSDVKRGDILVFKMGKNSGHVGIALGDGTMVHAGSSSGKVLVSNHKTDYWKKTFYTAYRIF